MSVKYTTPAQHKSNLRNVYGTFAIEGMTISKDTRSNLDRIGSGQASYQQVVNELLSKYDVYTTVQSMYCYPDTDVLINKLNIHDKAELKQAEEEFTAVKQMALLQEPIKGRFTKTHLFRIHRFLFEDVYPFAGHIRKEQISKGDTMFYPPDLIDRELERVFKTIHSKKLLAEQDKEKQIQNLSQTMAGLNIIHPFREGNGRSTRELIRCMALEYGLHINWGNTDRGTLINAAIAAVDDDMAFCDVLKQCIE